MSTYNPLDKRNLATSIAKQLLQQPMIPLPTVEFVGAGVYAIYYLGSHQPYAPYEPIKVRDVSDEFARPIYVGKAVPSGSRIGALGLDVDPGKALFRRLFEHRTSLMQVHNLAEADFVCRYILLDDVWISLGEGLMITLFEPVWNKVVAGFGNHDPGAGRARQQRSYWDTLHPGRSWAAVLQPNKVSEVQLVAQIERLFAGMQPLITL